MYDHDIVETGELIKAETAWAAGVRPDATEVHRKLEAELAAGRRIVDKARQHKGAAVRAGLTRRLSMRAKRAWLTRKARS